MAKVAVVTGSYKGIGNGVVKGLCKQFDGDVYMTARNPKSAEKAVEDLKKEGLNPRFHQLDINDPNSIDRLRLHLEQNYGGLDVLVNNAAVAFPMKSTAPFSEQAETTMKTNFYATMDVCNKLFPLLRDNARVVHVSSGGGAYALGRCTPEAKQRIKAIKTVAGIEELVNEFVSVAKTGKVKDLGMPENSYGVSKMAVNLVTPIQQEQFDRSESKRGIIVNACCPGLVATDMSGHIGVSPDQGADTPLYLALLPPDDAANPRGKFVSDRIVRDIESTDEEIKQINETLQKISSAREKLK